mgnify:CR=1 FL=1|jgi:ABC-2 type transport system ATP-binding protein
MLNMAESVLRTHNLTKVYKNTTVVNNVSLSIERGQIYGLVGVNGAGKTSLIRMITSQAFKNSGEIELFGKISERELNEMRKRTGAIVETPSFYPFFTAKENLEYYRIQRGIKDKECVDQVLREVNLQDTGKKKFKDFSLGMKQRLGLALALMNNPEFLILDEPINGLDPIGIIEFRDLLLKLNKEKKITILISSHILSELQSLATHYGFIHKGKLIKEISAQELTDLCSEFIELKVNDIAKAEMVLQKELNCNKYDLLPGNIIKVYDFLSDPEELSKVMMKNNIIISLMSVKRGNLEEYFLSLIGGKGDA